MNRIFKSSAGFLDLSTIVVGVIIISLMSGVIAATIFAVIPWSKDNAAKQQAESIHTAENALYGLSTDENIQLIGNIKKSFGDSTDLYNNNLLSKGDSYCVRTLEKGKDYQLWVKSTSGKFFTAKNSDKTPLPTKNFPCEDGIFTSE